MKFKRKKRSSSAVWVLVGGAVLTGVAAVFVSKLLKSGPVTRRRELWTLEKSVVRTLLTDEVASGQGINVSAVGSGVVELSGVVDQGEDARHIVSVVDAIPGVHTVLNRLEIRSVEARLKKTRTRGDGAGVRWYGGGVGMGRRRQSPSTDPTRRDDHVSLLTRAQQPNRDDTLADVEEAEGERARIGVSHSGAFSTRVPPASPDPAADRPGPPPEVAPHDAAQRQ